MKITNEYPKTTSEKCTTEPDAPEDDTKNENTEPEQEVVKNSELANELQRLALKYGKDYLRRECLKLLQTEESTTESDAPEVDTKQEVKERDKTESRQECLKAEESTTESDDPGQNTKNKQETKPNVTKTVPKKQSENANSELTSRLQKLALKHSEKEDRQEQLKVIQADTSSHLSSAKTFQELNLPKHLLDAIFAMGFNRPSAIQGEALPRILAKRNVIGQAKSGSGKTAAFVVGMLCRITVDHPATTQALCVTPTRELAVQIFQEVVTPMAANMTGLKLQLALAGEFMAKGVDAHLVIGTPGKVVDWLKRGMIQTDNIKVFVLDEADDMVGGHRANSRIIKNMLPKTCQCLLFSATFTPEVIKFADKMVPNADKILIEAGPEYLVLDVIKQLWVDTQEYEGGKLQFLGDIYMLLTIGKSIVFVGTRKDADKVHKTLTDEGYSCSILHSQLEKAERDETMAAFRKGESTVLITTNVLARGVNVDNVCLVVNYDVPVDGGGNPDYDTYLHRIGRTGRFGRKGTAINLVSDSQSIQTLAAIEAHFSKNGKEMIQKAPADPEALASLIEI